MCSCKERCFLKYKVIAPSSESIKPLLLSTGELHIVPQIQSNSQLELTKYFGGFICHVGCVESSDGSLYGEKT